MNEIPDFEVFNPKAVFEADREIYDEILEEHVQGPIELNEAGVARYNETLALVPEGYELWGIWSKDYLHLGVPTMEGFKVLEDREVYDNQGAPIEGHVYLIRSIPRSQAA